MKRTSEPTFEHQMIWDWINRDGEAEQYQELFERDAKEFGTLVAIYNIGFLIGWDDGNEQAQKVA